jgi:hypothetical protein
MDFDKIIAFLDNPGVKYVLTIVGGFIVARVGGDGTKIKKLTAAITGGCGLIITLLHMLFPEAAAAPVAPAVASVAMFASAGAVAVNASIFNSPIVVSLFADWLIPWLSGVGTHSTIKNTLEARKV